MFERWNRHKQLQKAHKKCPALSSKGIWIEHKGKIKVNLCN
jgi:hypothetical protein